jgi:hypothetical protein
MSNNKNMLAVIVKESKTIAKEQKLSKFKVFSIAFDCMAFILDVDKDDIKDKNTFIHKVSIEEKVSVEQVIIIFDKVEEIINKIKGLFNK